MIDTLAAGPTMKPIGTTEQEAVMLRGRLCTYGLAVYSELIEKDAFIDPDLNVSRNQAAPVLHGWVSQYVRLVNEAKTGELISAPIRTGEGLEHEVWHA